VGGGGRRGGAEGGERNVEQRGEVGEGLAVGEKNKERKEGELKRSGGAVACIGEG